MIPRHAVDSMKCSLCQNGLSVFPIHSYGEKDMVTCGRCPIKEEFLPQREHLYEQLGQHIEFSCRFQDKGCIVKLKPSDLQNHENVCPHKPCLCPILPRGKCEWQGSYKDLVEHCTDCHPAMTFKNLQVEVNVVSSYEVNYVIDHRGETFIATLKCDLTDHKIYWNVISWNMQPARMKFSYCVNFGNNATNFSCDPQVISFCNLSEFANSMGMTSIDINDIFTNLKGPPCIICNIKITVTPIKSAGETTNMIDGNEMLSTLECPICLEYMVPPIAQCNTGHSFCGSHKRDIDQCPSCKDDIGETRNYLLEKITSIVQYPCKHVDCPYLTKAENIRAHEAKCTYGPYKCIIRDCAWEQKFSELKDHLLQEHKDNILETSSITYIVDFTDESCSYVIFSYNKIFKVLFNKEGDEFIWSLQMVGDDEDHTRFMLELDFASLKKGRIYITHECDALHEDDDEIDNELCIKLNEDQLKNFIVEDILTYKVRVVPSV